MSRFQWTIASVVLWGVFFGVTASLIYAQSDGDMAIELSGFSASEAYDLEAGDALDVSEEKLMKLLFRSGKVSSVNFRKWSQFAAEVSWTQVLESPEQFRFWTFQRELTLRYLELLRFPPELVTDELKGVYVARCVDASQQPVILLTRSAPRKLKLNQPLDQPISFTGFFYNNVAVNFDGSPRIAEDNEDEVEAAEVEKDENDQAGIGDGPAVPLFIANRFAWYPTEPDDSLSVSRGQANLAAHGVDVGLFDYVRKQNSKPLSGYDADAFYQMLAAANAIESADGSESGGVAESGISFTDLMSAPTKHFGSAVNMSGRLRQCVPIQIVDSDRKAQVGLDHYYQVSLFPDLDGRGVVVRTSGNESIKFDQFPVTVCLPQLPQGMTAAELEGRAVQVEGYFYRFIKYQSKVSQDANQSGQVSPMVIACRVNVTSTGTTAEGVDTLMRGLLIAILGVVAIAVAYGVWAAPTKRSRLVAGEGETLPEKIDLSQFEDQIDD